MKTRRSALRIAAFVTVVLTLCLSGPADSIAQGTGTPIVIGESHTLRSDALDEDRTVLVATPRDYDASGTRYPVLYLLDGDAHLLHTAGLVDFLASNGRMPEAIVVGLPNTDRTRDLTPALKNGFNTNMPTAGGADAFLSFITDELMPFVEERYRTAPYTILIGHSFGGLFAVHTLMTQPDAFDALIAISPSLWWDRQEVVTRSNSFFGAHPDLDGFLYMTLGSEGGNMVSSIRSFTKVLEERAPSSFEWHFVLMEKENHSSVPHRSTYDALETLYDGWALPQGIVHGGDLEAFDRHYAALSARFGYEIKAPEETINRLGYRLMSEKKIEDAIEVFERNADRYPGSANAYDSLGDAYDAAGLWENALKSYGKACSMAEVGSHPNAERYCANAQRAADRIAETGR